MRRTPRDTCYEGNRSWGMLTYVPRKVFTILLKNLNLIFLINRSIPCAKFVHNAGPDIATNVGLTDVCPVNRP